MKQAFILLLLSLFTSSALLAKTDKTIALKSKSFGEIVQKTVAGNEKPNKPKPLSTSTTVSRKGFGRDNNGFLTFTVESKRETTSSPAIVYQYISIVPIGLIFFAVTGYKL